MQLNKRAHVGYLVDVKPIPNPPMHVSTAASGGGGTGGLNADAQTPQKGAKAAKGPTWQGAGCAVMGSVGVVIQRP